MHYHGITARTAYKLYVTFTFPHSWETICPSDIYFLTFHSAALAGGFGGVAGIFALFFFAEVPRVSKDIMQKVPVLGNYFVKTVAPEDNPF